MEGFNDLIYQDADGFIEFDSDGMDDDNSRAFNFVTHAEAAEYCAIEPKRR